MVADGGRMLDGPPPSSIPRLSPRAHPAGGVGRPPARDWTTAAPLTQLHPPASTHGSWRVHTPSLPKAPPLSAHHSFQPQAMPRRWPGRWRRPALWRRPAQPHSGWDLSSRGRSSRAGGGSVEAVAAERRRRMLAAMGAARVWRSPGPSAAALRLQRVWRQVCLSRLGQRPRHGRRRLCRCRCAPARGQRRSRWHRRHAVGSAGAALDTAGQRRLAHAFRPPIVQSRGPAPPPARSPPEMVSGRRAEWAAVGSRLTSHVHRRALRRTRRGRGARAGAAARTAATAAALPTREARLARLVVAMRLASARA